MSIMVRACPVTHHLPAPRCESAAPTWITGVRAILSVVQIVHSIPTTFNGEIIEPLSHEWAQCAFALALFAAIIQLLMGFFRIGFFMNFVSEPVIAGFTSAAALLIASSQVREGVA